MENARTTTALVRKGYCPGCPFDYGKEETETAYNLGCLPGIGDINARCVASGTAWACHSEPQKVCCGHGARRHLPLLHEEGVHSAGGRDPER
jgi:hypothetical protein